LFSYGGSDPSTIWIPTGKTFFGALRAWLATSVGEFVLFEAHVVVGTCLSLDIANRLHLNPYGPNEPEMPAIAFWQCALFGAFEVLAGLAGA
jgi:hypothetical protein